MGIVIVISHDPAYFIDLSCEGREKLYGPWTQYEPPHWNDSVVLHNGNIVKLQQSFPYTLAYPLHKLICIA
jgi:hypothetical protein